MVKGILFDLDDTLLRNDMSAFVQAYFSSLAPRIADFFPQNDFIPIITQATQAMVQAPRSARTLRQVFIEHFEKLSGLEFGRLEPIFLHYYQNEFKSVRAVSQPMAAAPAVMEAALKLTDRLVLATIPIFPLIAIQERLRWAGLQDIPFRLVTSFEIMHCCKPNPDYFIEIAEMVGCRPEDCLMVGNDHVDDLAAKSAGMTTFLVTDFARNAGKSSIEPDYSGSINDLLSFLRRLYQ